MKARERRENLFKELAHIVVGLPSLTSSGYDDKICTQREIDAAALVQRQFGGRILSLEDLIFFFFLSIKVFNWLE